MVVPQYPPPVVGGLERQAHELSKAVKTRGIDVLVMSGKTSPEQPTRQTVEGVPVLRLRFPSNKWLRFPGTGLAVLRAMLQERARFDVVHVHNLSWFGTFAVLVAHALRRPVLAKLPTAIQWAFKEGSLRFRIFLHCDAIALMSKDSIRDFRRRGFPEDRILKITNGVSTALFSPRPRTRGESARSLTVVFVGRLDPEKGLLDLIAIWPDVVARCGQAVRLEICGDGPLEGELRNAIRARGVSESVILRGHVLDVPEALRSADVFVLPSDIEGNSNAVLEAMASGLPVVSTRVGGTPLLVGPDGADWLVEPHDRASLEDCLVRLLQDSAMRERVGNAMLARVHAHFTIEAVAARYCEVYKRLAEGNRESVGAASSPVFSS